MNSKKVWAIVGGVTFILFVCLLMILLIPNTEGFRAAFRNNCEKFPETSTNCEKLLKTFEEAYVGKDPSCFPEDDYDPVFSNFPFKHSGSKTMLWSNTKDLVQKFTERTKLFTTLKDTLLGSVLDGKIWCGLKGLKDTFCIICKGLVKSPVHSFWRKASAKFAEHAEGVVTAMLNGDSKKPPYRPDSFFGGIEIPHLKSPRVKQLDVILVTEKGTCENESLKELETIIRNKNIGYRCVPVTRAKIEKCIESNTACW